MTPGAVEALHELAAMVASGAGGEALADHCLTAVGGTLACECVEVRLTDASDQITGSDFGAMAPAEAEAVRSLLMRDGTGDTAAVWASAPGRADASVCGIAALLPGPDQHLGVLLVSTSDPREFSQSDVRFVSAVAALLSTVMQRDRAAAAQHRIGSRVREATDALPVFVWLADADGRLAYFNQRLLTFTGHTIEAQVDAGWSGVVHPDDTPRFMDALDEAVATRTEFECEARLRNAAGGYKWFLHRAAPAFSADAGQGGLVGSSIEITHRRRAMAALQAIADLGAQLSPSLDRRDIAAVLARLMVARGFGQIALVDLADAETAGHTVVSASAGGGPAAAIERLVASIESGAEGSLGARAVALASAAVLQPPFHGVERSALTELGIHAAVGVPLLAQGRLVGALVLLTTTDNASDEMDIELAQELAGRAALAINNASLYAESQRQAALAQRSNQALQFLANAGIELSRLFQDDQTLQRVAQLAVPAFADLATIDLLADDGTVTRAGVAAVSTRLNELASQLGPAHGLGEGSFARELHDGHSLMVSRLGRRHMRMFGSVAQRQPIPTELQSGSVLFIPMSARGHVLGLLTFVRQAGRVAFTSADLSGVGDQLGRRAGLSVDNARLFAASRAREVELAQANVAKDEFLGLMSHELRTPITVINGGARILETRGATLPKAARAEIVADISHESSRLAAMLEDMLALSRIELNQRPVLEPVLLHRLIEQLAGDAPAGQRQRHLTLSIEPRLPPVAAEPSYIDHIFRNMLSNAAKYTPEASPIEITVTLEGAAVAVRVLDRGPGVPPDEIGRLFDRFYRAEQTARLANGAGMGLPVCKRLVEAMSGEIWGRLRDGGGLDIGFSLPLYHEEEL